MKQIESESMHYQREDRPEVTNPKAPKAPAIARKIVVKVWPLSEKNALITENMTHIIARPR